MPMLTTLRMRLPVWPFHAPLRTRLAKVSHLVEHSMDLGTTFSPSTMIVPLSARAGPHADGAIFREVDLLAAEHGIDPRRAGRIPPRVAGGA